MEVIDAIFSRQSYGRFKSDPVPHDVIERLLSAAVQAPNHYKIRPWRFVVLTGTGRERLGQVMANAFLADHPDLPPEALEKERNKPLRAPLVIAVGVDKPTEARHVEIENVSAAAAACQNLLLVAHAEGLSARWRTGSTASDPRVKQFLGFEPDQHLIAFIYIGYPDGDPGLANRPSFEDRTIWMEN